MEIRAGHSETSSHSHYSVITLVAWRYALADGLL